MHPVNPSLSLRPTGSAGRPLRAVSTHATSARATSARAVDRWPAALAAGLLGLAVLSASPAWAQAASAPAVAQPAPQAPLQRDQLERRVQSVGTLIEASSAARQIEGSGVASARERRDTARLMHREAQAALQGEDLAGAARLLDQAAREMMAGVRLAKPEQVAGEKAQRDFAARLDSAKALLAAQQRITREKSAGREAQDAARQIERQIGEAQALAGQGRYDQARPVLDRAYLSARVSIEAMRRGDTLVRSLSFATPREEYDYELDRNETHKMLVQVVLADRKDGAANDAPMPTGMQGFVDRAAELRAEAEGLAQRSDHAGAIQRLEASTRELVRAIRAGGLYIPG